MLRKLSNVHMASILSQFPPRRAEELIMQLTPPLRICEVMMCMDMSTVAAMFASSETETAASFLTSIEPDLADTLLKLCPMDERIRFLCACSAQQACAILEASDEKGD